MFALIENGIPTTLAASIPPAPDPIPDGYIAPDWRPVVEGVEPPATTAFSSPVEKPLAQWTVNGMEVIREYTEHIPSVGDCRAIKRARLALATQAARDTGISVTLTLPGPVTPYGILTFSHDSITDLLACAYICDMEIRANGANANNLVTLIQSDLSPVQVTCSHALRIVPLVCDIHRNRHIALSAKLRAAQQAATLNDLNTIE